MIYHQKNIWVLWISIQILLLTFWVSTISIVSIAVRFTLISQFRSGVLLWVSVSCLGYTYRYFNGTVQFPFGFGLSYTQFQYSAFSVARSNVGPCDDIEFTVDITNIGSVDGDEVVQLYVQTPNATVPSPSIRLAAFERVHIPVQQTVTVNLFVTPDFHSVVYDGNDIYHPTRMVEAGLVIAYVGNLLFIKFISLLLCQNCYFALYGNANKFKYFTTSCMLYLIPSLFQFLCLHP